MGALVKLRKRARVTLPQRMVKKLGLKTGDRLKIAVKKGRLVMTPVKVIPKEELWAWKPEIRAAIEEGRREAFKRKLKTYGSVDKMWADIEDRKSVV